MQEIVVNICVLEKEKYVPALMMKTGETNETLTGISGSQCSCGQYSFSVTTKHDDYVERCHRKRRSWVRPARRCRRSL